MNTLFQSRISFWAFLCTGNKNKQTKYLVILFVLIDNIFNVVAFAFTELFGKQGKRKHLKLFRVLRKTSEFKGEETNESSGNHITSTGNDHSWLSASAGNGNCWTRTGIDSMKALVTNIMLPVAIFPCTGDIGLWSRNGKAGRDHVHHVGCIFWHRISYEAAYIAQKITARSLPFMVSVYEGGSMAYPLYTSLCGQDNLSQIARFLILRDCFSDSVFIWECLRPDRER